MALMTSRTNWIWSLHILSITIIIHDIWQETMNILTSWSGSERPHCSVSPGYVQLCNPHRTPLYLKPSNFLKEFLEGTETADSTLHNKSTLILPAHTHTHVIIQCEYRRGGVGNELIFLNKM